MNQLDGLVNVHPVIAGNSFSEEYMEKNLSLNKNSGSIFDIKPIDLDDITIEDRERFSTE